MQKLYDRYGREIYERAAADPAFSAAISDLVALMGEELPQEGPSKHDVQCHAVSDADEHPPSNHGRGDIP
ncbi:hypothetical protein ACIBQX_35350 [Nonomuraea sp. NPDC049714]|uniref:hypothetical protein n=1 Tax=Nonomuraea sp. NPDC049714 TaxID=3364357 RepID=UPI00379B696D